MEQLTEKTYTDVIQSIKDQGVGLSKQNQRYLKLAEYEDIEELFLNLSPYLEKMANY